MNTKNNTGTIIGLAIGVIAWLLSLIPRRINRAAAQEPDAGRLP